MAHSRCQWNLSFRGSTLVRSQLDSDRANKQAGASAWHLSPQQALAQRHSCAAAGCPGSPRHPAGVSVPGSARHKPQTMAGHRPIPHHRSGEPAQAQACHKGDGLPMSMWNANPQALPSHATPIQACHLGRGAGLVDEHQPFWVEIQLPVKPGLPRGPDVGPVALAGVSGFLTVIARAWKKRRSVSMPAETLCSSLKWVCIS
jgi:hypothetical protein